MISAQDLKGIIVPVVTPVTEDDRVDFAGLRRSVRHVLAGGVHGVFALGGTGNFCAFTAEERFEIARAVVAEVKGQVPVLVGCMDSSTRLVLRNVQQACAAGADAVVVEPPFYYPPTAADLWEHFSAVAAASQVPIVLYNVPDANKVHMDVPLLRRLVTIPKIAGIKDSSSDFSYFQEMLAAFPGGDFRLLQGQEPLLGASFLLGAHGAILAAANVAPRLCADLYEAGTSGNLARTQFLQAQMMAAFGIFRQMGDDPALAEDQPVTVASFFAGLQSAMQSLGVCQRIVTVPFQAPSPAQQERVKRILMSLELIPRV